MKVKRNDWKRILAVCLLISILGGCTIKTPGEDGTTVRITHSFKEHELFYLEKELCTVSEAKLFLMNQKNLYTSRYGEEIWTATYEGEPLYTYLEENLRDFLVRLKCMVLMASANEISLSEDDLTLINLAVDDYMKALSPGELAYCGASREDVTTAFSDYYLANKLYRVLTQDAVKEISDDEARVITVQMIYLPYDKESDHTTEAPTVDAGSTEAESPAETNTEADSASSAADEKQITNERLIRELHKRATQDEEDFYHLAESYSRGTWTEKQIRRGEMDPAVEKAAFALSSGVISKVVNGDDGYYLIKCINNHEVELTRQHRDELIEAWKQQVFKTAYDAFVSNLYLGFNDPAWEKIDFGAAAPDYKKSFYSCYEEFLSGNE